MDDGRPGRAALHVSVAALLLAAAKAAAGIFSGSVAVLSSALDSAADALASFANLKPSRRRSAGGSSGAW